MAGGSWRWVPQSSSFSTPSTPTPGAFSDRVFGLAAELSPDLETYLDDAYIDLTGTECLHGHLIRAADELRCRIRRETGLSVALGLASNRMGGMDAPP